MLVFKCKNHHHYQQKNGKIHKETRENDQIQKIKTNLQKSIAKRQKPLHFLLKIEIIVFKKHNVPQKKKKSKK